MMGKNKLVLCLFALLAAAVTGCGNTAAGPASTLAASEGCIGCHGANVSPVTAAYIADEWKASHHNSETAGKKVPGYGAGCSDCHEPAAGHPNSCSRCHGGTPATLAERHDVTSNPDSALKCLKCHAAGTLGAPHFTNMTTLTAPLSGYPASFASSRYTGNCRKCHNPHDPTTVIAVNRQWARSGHGDTTAPPWTRYDFKTRGTAGADPAGSVAADCVRCHTTTGYINYVKSAFKNISAWGNQDLVNVGTATRPNYFSAADKTKQVLGCNACHDDGNENAYNWSKQRKVSPITAFYNYSSAVTGKLLVSFPFPDVATSNICMACHTGRESGRTIKAIEAVEGASGAFKVFSSAGGMSFINSHYLTAGATVFKSSGYEYPGRDYSNSPDYLHDRIGVANLNGTGASGPCVTCHMKPGRHTFLPVSKDPATGAVISLDSAICANCHSGTNAMTAARVEEEQAGFLAALAALAEGLKVRGYVFIANSPYFSNKNWQTDKGSKGGYGPGTGGPTMGAAFNFNLLRHDFGAFAHNSLYVKRLIHDSLDWIANGILDNDVEAAINALPDDPELVFNIDGSTVNFNAEMKQRAMAYLLGTDANPTGAGGARP
ncbi:MAG: cytochrome C [Geobacteraceae bacterium]|nr:cytochrome C [Geobacteraceae bacterium]